MHLRQTFRPSSSSVRNFYLFRFSSTASVSSWGDFVISLLDSWKQGILVNDLHNVWLGLFFFWCPKLNQQTRQVGVITCLKAVIAFSTRGFRLLSPYRNIPLCLSYSSITALICTIPSRVCERADWSAFYLSLAMFLWPCWTADNKRYLQPPDRITFHHCLLFVFKEVPKVSESCRWTINL